MFKRVKITVSRLQILALVLWLALMSVGPIYAELAGMNQPGADGLSGLCRTGAVEEVAAAIAAGADVNAVDDRGRTPLMVVSGELVEMAAGKAELLLKAGADPGLTDPLGLTALDHALANNSPAAGQIASAMEAALKSGPPE